MGHRHEGRGKLQQWVGGIVILATVLFASALPGHTRGGGGHGFHGGRGFQALYQHSCHGVQSSCNALSVKELQQRSVIGLLSEQRIKSMSAT
jgi:hypothetical protein